MGPQDAAGSDVVRAALAAGAPRPGDQPLPEAATGPSMHDLVCEDLRTRWSEAPSWIPAPSEAEIEAVIAGLQERKRLGVERYGSLLQAGNGRDAVRDLAEELQDAVAYCMQVIVEDGLPASPGTHRAQHAQLLYEGLAGMLFRVRWLRADS